MNFNFTFNAVEVNMILEALGELPHKRVSNLSMKILTLAKATEIADDNRKKEEAKAAAEAKKTPAVPTLVEAKKEEKA